MKRASGILLPMSSLPSPYGIGTMGKAAYEFVDFLVAAGQTYWQLLPLGPTSMGDSPYSSFSSFAGNPYYIDLDMLCDKGLIGKDDIMGINWGDDPERTDYGKIYDNRLKVLKKAFLNADADTKKQAAAFSRENSAWLDDYALFMAVKQGFGMKSWLEWPDDDIRLYAPEAVKKYRNKYKEETEFFSFIQYLFFEQWDALRSYAHEKGIKFIGDLPIYTAMDSADVWKDRSFFMLDEDGKPTLVAGVPPDIYNEDGQLWGNPIYDWAAMKADGYGWWIRRVDASGKLFDVLRIDHFRGFASYWAVEYGEKTAKVGEWLPGPGMGLVGVLTSWFPNIVFVAEDLGYPTPEVEKLLKDSGLPGMKVLQFAFTPDEDSAYNPHNCGENSICYIGTHDNETAEGWAASAPEEVISFAERYLRKTPEESWSRLLFLTGMSTSSAVFVAQMQDILGLGNEARMNTPGVPYGNWQWRLKSGAATLELAEDICSITKMFGRLNPKLEACSEEDEEEKQKQDISES